ncbi:MAG: hypothetical protein M1838_000285 [Thelocarpon superellum]|nr:MAG: hypothetical protein M1838_000285 [Thelocarpon superellum]
MPRPIRTILDEVMLAVLENPHAAAILRRDPSTDLSLNNRAVMRFLARVYHHISVEFRHLAHSRSARIPNDLRSIRDYRRVLRDGADACDADYNEVMRSLEESRIASGRLSFQDHVFLGFDRPPSSASSSNSSIPPVAEENRSAGFLNDLLGVWSRRVRRLRRTNP